MWIRGLIFDGCFFLSGLPLGLALVVATGPWYDWPDPQHYGHSLPLLLIFSLVPLLETGHSLSPIALAWSHTGFRRLMMGRPAKYVILPGIVFATALGIGAATSRGLTSYVFAPHHMFLITGLTNPFPILVWVYMLWNAYHFGMQNFGVLQIYRRLRINERQSRTPGPSLDKYRPRGRGSACQDSARSRIVAIKAQSHIERSFTLLLWAHRRLYDAVATPRSIDRTFCLTVTCAAMATAFPVAWLHEDWVRDLCVTLSLLGTSLMLGRELWLDAGWPRFVFILADGLGLALIWWQPLVGMAVYSFNHWLVAIGLASHVSPVRWWLFALAMLMIGAVGYLWMRPAATGSFLVVIPWILSARLGLGIVHFLADRAIWKRSSPIMRDLLAA